MEQGKRSCEEDGHTEVSKVGSQGIDNGPSELTVCLLHGLLEETCSRISKGHNIDAGPPWHTVSTVHPRQNVQ